METFSFPRKRNKVEDFWKNLHLVDYLLTHCAIFFSLLCWYKMNLLLQIVGKTHCRIVKAVGIFLFFDYN